MLGMQLVSTVADKQIALLRYGTPDTKEPKTKNVNDSEFDLAIAA